MNLLGFEPWDAIYQAGSVNYSPGNRILEAENCCPET
jgi:hypothetical protein